MKQGFVGHGGQFGKPLKVLLQETDMIQFTFLNEGPGCQGPISEAGRTVPAYQMWAGGNEGHSE